MIFANNKGSTVSLCQTETKSFVGFSGCMGVLCVGGVFWGGWGWVFSFFFSSFLNVGLDQQARFPHGGFSVSLISPESVGAWPVCSS